MSNSKISVIIPVYNVEKYLSECLDSIVNQTLKDIEIICINDGSTDNSLQILKEYASKDTRIKIIDKENEGQGYARKVGLDVANGEYILFCDSDDYYFSNDVFEKLYVEIKKKKSELMIFRFSFGNKISNSLDNYKVINKDNKSKFFFHLYFAPWFKIYKKSFLDRYTEWCFPKYLKFQDMPFHIQSCIRAESISYFDKVCYSYREDNPTNITNSKIGKKHVENICEIILLVYDILKRENKIFEYEKEFVYLAIDRIKLYFDSAMYYNNDLILKVKTTFEYLKEVIENVIKEYDKQPLLSNKNDFPYLTKDYILFYKLFVKLDLEVIFEYIDVEKTIIKKLQNSNNISIEEHNRRIQEQDLIIKRLQNSWSYRIGRLFTYPLSIPLEFFKFISDYNLLKKSDLFDIEYYLANNEDVKKAKMNPIKHYLKFGWKEGRNPSEKFDGNEYLDQRPDVRVSGICPLVHYIKFGIKDEGEDG